MKKKIFVYMLLSVVLLSSCIPAQATEVPGLIYTVVASTQTAAAWQTQRADASFTKTLTPAVLRPTFTAVPSMTAFVYQVTASPTLTFTPTFTSTPPILTAWPDWKTGDVIVMPRGSGENIGTNKMFSVLVDVQVIIVRKNGVKLRSIPNKAQPGPLEEPGAALTLTGVMNKNNEYGWMFAQVKAADGQTYWVGGTDGEDTDPRKSFIFYYPHLTKSPTPSATGTFVPTATVTFSPSHTPTLTETATPVP